MNRVRCFLIEPTDRVRMSLRRYSASGGLQGECPVHGYHNASAEIGDDALAAMPKISKYVYGAVHGDLWPHDDPRWPTHCACGYAFTPSDNWQFNPDTLYRRADTGELMTDRSAPPGALRYAGWLHDFGGGYQPGPDGKHLQCKLPDGRWWVIDGPASNAPRDQVGWTRTGTVPDVTARPSIQTPGYHGFLTDGWLEEC
jgi:hypothetical protein